MTLSAKARSALAGRLARDVEGDLLFDSYSRARYATDASPYQSFPAGIVVPKSQADVVAAMSLAWEAGVPVVARGGGTGRAGQAVGEGLVIDFSKYLTRLLYYDANAQTCIVEPGMTPAALNDALKPERVWFPVEIASAAQATLGGMAATDAIGARALRYGRMRNNVAALDAVLADGSEISFGEIPENFGHEGSGGESEALILDLLEAAESSEAAIRALPSTLGAMQGYNVQALLPGEAPQNLAAFLTGSEGTLAIARRIELKLARWPRARVLGICGFPGLVQALRALPAISGLDPVGIELIDRRILELGLAAQEGAESAKRVLRKDAEILLFVEFMEANRIANARKLKDLAELMHKLGHARAVNEMIGAAVQEATQRARGQGLARLYGRSALPMQLAPIQEFALPVPQLPGAAEGLAEIMLRHGFDMMWHGYAGAGALQVRPWLRAGGLGQIDAGAMAAEVTAVYADFAGQLAVAEGHGIARSFLREGVRDPRLTSLFEAIKTRFDPRGRLNPGKIVAPPPGPDAIFWRSAPPAETAPPPALASALACDGTALCRKLDSGVMCPSFRMTRDERDSPRGRANTLRLALSGDLGPGALASEGMAETMSLCVSCKACRAECPRSVDIAQARIAVQSAQLSRTGLSRSARSLAYLPHYAPRLRPWRHGLNLRDLLPWTARLSERFTGLSADRPWPRWTAAPFASSVPPAEGSGPEILLFADTFNNYFDADTLRAAADVLTASGYRLRFLAPPAGERPYCCGRTFLEAGLIDEARAEARRLIDAAAPFIARGIPLVGLEPACILTIRDEFLNTLGETGADDLAANSFLFEEVMIQPAAAKALKPQLLKIEAEAVISAHCHQTAFGTAAQARKVAALVPGMTVIEAEKACCGMGTSFGYRPETVAASLRMGELSLFPQIRRTGPDTLLIADGFACRRQIMDGTGRTARHTAVLLKLALAAKEKFGSLEEAGHQQGAKLAKRVSRLRRSYFR
ncbi:MULTISPECIES: FAD-binding and (Fe-S)-binding domain-containing protein [Rhodomicrobium]|uniref:FAD-binding and (Fe-S)-binding domain-containing protein n=1 Tax=Rhodomicrobium TaxID=1068 RepID=UPI000B4B7CAB|nr:MULTISPECIES: FAD-binding and (Fe-S)-binding domain-containing protein [Rhodomicrobium]